ncbi:ABC transporter permease [bacterium]|nr:ABC transporter permease [bacterium]
MNSISRALKVEILKMRRSRVPSLCLLAISLGPIVGSLFMIILQDPEHAKEMGIIGTKAQLAGSADWETHLSLLPQIISTGGTIVYSFLVAWIFGREFSNRTVRYLLAVPTPRPAIVTAKLIVATVWSIILSLWVFFCGTMGGILVGLENLEIDFLLLSFKEYSITSILTIILITPVAFVASYGRGYLPALGFAIFTVFLGQISGVLGWGGYVPWAIPALYSGAAGPRADFLFPGSFPIVIVTSLLGLIATFWWWKTADQRE